MRAPLPLATTERRSTAANATARRQDRQHRVRDEIAQVDLADTRPALGTVPAVGADVATTAIRTRGAAPPVEAQGGPAAVFALAAEAEVLAHLRATALDACRRPAPVCARFARRAAQSLSQHSFRLRKS